MKTKLTSFCVNVLVVAVLTGCAGSALQAPAFYAAPALENEQAPPKVPAAAPANVVGLQPAAKAVDTPSVVGPVLQLTVPPVPAVAVPLQVQAPGGADSLLPLQQAALQPGIVGGPVFRPAQKVANTTQPAPADGGQTDAATSLPRLEDMPPERRLPLQANEPEGLVLLQPAPAGSAAVQDEQPAPPAAVANMLAQQNALLAAEQQEVVQERQLLQAQNRLLKEQLKSMQVQQNYLQQQNERILALVLEKAEEKQRIEVVVESPDREIITPDEPAGYPREEREEVAKPLVQQRNVVVAGPDSTYMRMEAKLAMLALQMAQLQQAVQNNAKEAVVPVLPTPRTDTIRLQADTSLLSTIEQLRQQLSALQERQQVTAPQQPPLSVYFASGASAISAEGAEKLAEWVENAKALEAGYSIVLNGFTDKRGPAELNLRLANKRIQAVKAALIGLGVPQSSILSGYMGIDLQQEDLANARRVQLLIKP